MTDAATTRHMHTLPQYPAAPTDPPDGAPAAPPPQGTGVPPTAPPPVPPTAPQPPATAAPSAETLNTESVPETWNDVFKHPRFAQLLGRAKSAEDKLAEIAAAKEAADAETAKQKGEYEKLYNQEREKAAALLVAGQAARVQIALRDYLQAEKPEYAARAKWIAPFIGDLKADAKDEDVAAAVKAAADAWIEANPVTVAPKVPGGPGNHAPRSNGGTKPNDDERRAQSYRPRL